MSIETALARAFGLKGRDDWRPHANPLSVYTRIPIPVLLVVSIWTYTWIGWWALVPVTIVLVWTLINPRVFPPPRSMNHWASRSVLGETYWAARKQLPVPERHRIAPLVLAAVAALGVPFIVWGLIVLNPWITALGLVLQTTGKLWFLDRMALLYDDVNADGPAEAPIHETRRSRRL